MTGLSYLLTLLQISVDINAFAGWLIVTIVGMVFASAVAAYIRMSKRIDALHEAHLGDRAIDSDGRFKWYRHDDAGAIMQLANVFREEAKQNREVIKQNTDVMHALLQEIKIDREVSQRLIDREREGRPAG